MLIYSTARPKLRLQHARGEKGETEDDLAGNSKKKKQEVGWRSWEDTRAATAFREKWRHSEEALCAAIGMKKNDDDE